MPCKGASFRITRKDDPNALHRQPDHRNPDRRPARRVWAVLADLPGWADWNPFITASKATCAPAGRITATMAPQGRRR